VIVNLAFKCCHTLELSQFLNQCPHDKVATTEEQNTSTQLEQTNPLVEEIMPLIHSESTYNNREHIYNTIHLSYQ
jgi:hypothetical protein